MSYSYNPLLNGGYIQGGQVKRRRRQRLFVKDIEVLLYSLGDGNVSQEGTMNALEDILVEYLIDLCQKCLQHANALGRTRIKLDDLPFALRDDPLKLARVEYILTQNARIEMAKKQFDTKKYDVVAEDSDGEEENNDKPKKTEGKKKRRKNAKQNDE